MNGYIKRSTLLATTLLGWLVITQPVHAASFDCGKATTKVEKLICADAELSKLDEELDAAYKSALQDEKQQSSIRPTQKKWMKERNGCSDAACVKLAYETRLQRLSPPASAADIGAIERKIASTSNVKKGCYKLVVGKRFAMCREFEKNLNRFCDEPPMMCRFKINPAFGKDFSMPKWEELDPAKNLDLVAEIVRSPRLAKGVPSSSIPSSCNQQCAEQEWQREKPGYMEGIRAGRVVLSRARFDLNHDGTPELVYRLSSSQCLPDDLERRVSVPYFTLMVMDEKTGKEDPDFASDMNVAIDVLLYQGRAHLVEWSSERILDGNATPGTDMGIPEGMTGGNFTIYDILSGPGIGRFAHSMRPLCGYNRLDKEEK